MTPKENVFRLAIVEIAAIVTFLVAIVTIVIANSALVGFVGLMAIGTVLALTRPKVWTTFAALLLVGSSFATSDLTGVSDGNQIKIGLSIALVLGAAGLQFFDLRGESIYEPDLFKRATVWVAYLTQMSLTFLVLGGIEIQL